MGTQADDTHLSEMGALEPSSVIPGWKIGIPLIRLFACGPFTIEVLHEVPGGDATQARYAPLPPERLHGRGPAPALTFLKLLTSQADRYAPKDWLIEHLRGDDYLITPKRLENIVSFVRQLLSLPDGTRPAGMLRYVRASHESGDGYRLAPYPLIWLDVDALAHTVRQACLLERFGDDPLPQWERAYQLASRGTYLSEEPYSDWAEVRREEVEGHLRQCVHALARLWLARQGEAAEEEVLHLLRGYWPRHPEDEDVAWGLMDLLGRRGRYQEALDIFACLEQSLEEQGLTKEGKPRVPDQRTRDLADYLRLKERQPLISRPSQWEPALPSSEVALVRHDGILAIPAENIEIPLSPSDQRKLPTPLWNVPHHRNPFFTGREDVLTHLHDVLHDVLNRKASGRGLTPLALCGLGGIGKTQCVLEYAYRYAHEYQAIFWIKADTRENLLADFLTLAGLLHLPEQSAEDRAVTVAAVQRWFQSQERWLLILDNVEELTLVREFLPSGLQGHVLFTTRMQALGGLAYGVPVEEMDQETGALFLLRRAGLCPPDTSRFDTTTASARLAQALVQELGGLPLALDQAGAYIEETASDLQAYLDGYHSSRQALLERRGGMTTDHPECVATTWTLAFTRIENSDPLAASLLHLCAFLDPDAIPEELLFAGLHHLTSSSGEIDLLRFNEAVGALLRFSLARRNGETRTLTLHRLVQAMIQDMMNPPQHTQYATPVIQALLSLFPHNIEVDNWPQCQRLLPHVHVVIAHPEWYSHAHAQIATLCNQAGYYLREQAWYQEAEVLYQKGLALREHCLGASHPDTAQICYNLGRLYFDTGQYTLSIQFHQRALAIREQVLAPDDFHIARSLNSLAFAYYIQDVATEEIEPLFLRALSIYEQAIGRDHPITSHCLSNLALFYASQDRFLEAERLLLEVQAIRERHLPPVHLDTARSLQNLAWLYIYQKKQDRYKEAKKLLERSLAIRSTLLGAFHPQVAISLHHLAWLLEAENNYTEAEHLYQQILSIRERSLGPASPKVALTRKHYAALLRKMGREEEATALEAHEGQGSDAHAFQSHEPTLSAQ